MKTTAKNTKVIAAKKAELKRVGGALKKVNLAEVGKKVAKKDKAEKATKLKKVSLTEVGQKKRGRKSNAEKAAELLKLEKKANRAAAKGVDIKKLKKVEIKTLDAAPKKSKDTAYDWAVANIKKPNDAAARKLVIGDVIEAFYQDDKKPRIEVVVCSCDKGETIEDVYTIPQESWQAGRVTHFTKVNTDMWRKVGTMKFKVVKD